MSEPKVWPLRLVIPGRFGKPITGVLILCVLLPLFYFGSLSYPSETTPSLFFGLIIAYMIPMFSHITTRTAEALQRLKPQLNVEEETFGNLRRRIYSGSPRLTWFDLGLGIFGALVHMSFVSGSVSAALARLMPSAPGFTSMVGAILVWVMMTTVISMLIQQARVFAQLGRDHVSVSLFATHHLLPFGGVSISASLAILGALTLFPLIGLEGDMNMKDIAPGAIATLVPLLVIFFMPVWPLHRRLVAEKTRQLLAVNERIDHYLMQTAGAENEVGAQSTPQFLDMLAYRREVTDSPTWPFDVSNVAKLTLYLVIPPLTWIAAALMENLVDAVL